MARIADEEVAHVAVGVYWFDSICEKLNCAPDFTFKGCEVWLISAYLLTYTDTNILKACNLQHNFLIPCRLTKGIQRGTKGSLQLFS